MDLGQVPPKELLQFTKKVATMIKAGLPILESIMMVNSNSSYENEMTAHTIIKDLNAGTNLTDAFANTKSFDNIYLNMISAEEDLN